MWRHQKAHQEDEQRIARGEPPIKRNKKSSEYHYKCKTCGQDKNKETDQSQLRGKWYCPASGRLYSNGKSVAWRKNGGTCLKFMVVQIGILVWRHLWLALGRQCLTIIEALEAAIINPITLYIGWMEYTEIGKFKPVCRGVFCLFCWSDGY